MAAGGGAWKVAYADFVTAMMAFFMVMWLTGQKEGVKEAVAGYFREPFATYKSHQKGAAATAKPVIDPMFGHTAQPQKRRLAISGDMTDYQFTILFPDGFAELEADQLKAIREVSPIMAGKLNRIEVRAHCIRSPLPSNSPFKDHWAMCFARCQRVRAELESLGIEPERIRLSQAEGNEPLAANLNPDELKLNSRVDVILLPDLADIPWERRRGDGGEPESEHQDDATAALPANAYAPHGAALVPASGPGQHDDQGGHDHPLLDESPAAHEHFMTDHLEQGHNASGHGADETHGAVAPHAPADAPHVVVPH